MRKRISGNFFRLLVIISLFLAYSFSYDYLFCGYGLGEKILQRVDNVVIRLFAKVPAVIKPGKVFAISGTPSNPPPAPPPPPKQKLGRSTLRE